MKKYLHEAYGFEEDVSYLLHFLAVANSAESSARRARRTMESCFHALSDRYLASLDRRYKSMSKEDWLKFGRPTRAKIKSDLKKYLARIPRAVERNVWRG